MARQSNSKSIINGEIVQITVEDTSKASRLAIRRKGELTRKMIENDDQLHQLKAEREEKASVVADLMDNREVDRQLQQLETVLENQTSEIQEVKSEIEELDLTIAALLKKC